MSVQRAISQTLSEKGGGRGRTDITIESRYLDEQRRIRARKVHISTPNICRSRYAKYINNQYRIDPNLSIPQWPLATYPRISTCIQERSRDSQTPTNSHHHSLSRRQCFSSAILLVGNASRHLSLLSTDASRHHHPLSPHPTSISQQPYKNLPESDTYHNPHTSSSSPQMSRAEFGVRDDTIR